MARTISAATKTLVAFMFFGLLAACNTIEGIGEDVSAGGEAVSDTAEETKGY